MRNVVHFNPKSDDPRPSRQQLLQNSGGMAETLTTLIVGMIPSLLCLRIVVEACLQMPSKGLATHEYVTWVQIFCVASRMVVMRPNVLHFVEAEGR